ncbi:NYN domain-containing protein [Leucobacter japonicus]|uniref:NYN domain-containing protein n=1 Tax=Leucobacter japonicus TaxID=1461259 RepID=UPI0006A7A5B8|nr:NYN domain-containing protein [Leucobacter japonicus]
MTTVELFIDYQNLHHSAHESFCRSDDDVRDCLIHPMKFAIEVLKKRTNETGQQGLSIQAVNLYRGMPNPRKEPRLASAASKQHSAWGRYDPRIKVHTRSLRYPEEWPDAKAEEKGVDVLLAVQLAQAAIAKRADLFIVVTRDTDLIPAVELARDVTPGCVEVATWYGQSKLRISGVKSLILGDAAFRASRDTTKYWDDFTPSY